jgi:hypothetical protein
VGCSHVPRSATGVRCPVWGPLRGTVPREWPGDSAQRIAEDAGGEPPTLLKALLRATWETHGERSQAAGLKPEQTEAILLRETQVVPDCTGSCAFALRMLRATGVENWVGDERDCSCTTRVYVGSSGWATRNLGITPWPLVRKRTIPTERPPLVGEI